MSGVMSYGECEHCRVPMKDSKCPGDHQHMQHRDGQLPWCEACGYTDAGLHRREVPAVPDLTEED
jgi:hypothetical protein